MVGKDHLDSLGGTREAGKDHLDSQGGRKGLIVTDLPGWTTGRGATLGFVANRADRH